MNRKRSRKMVFKSLGLIGSRVRMAASVIAVMVLCATAAFAGVNEDLISAADRGNLSEVQRLLSEGAEVNAKANDGITPLILASQKGHLEVSAMLIKAGAK